MIKYNLNNINDWNFGEDNIIKVYRNNAVCYYKITSGDTPTPVQEPCFAVVDNISQYSDTEFEDVFNLADEKWYKLNNLNQYEEYGIYGEGRNITYYEGKLTVDDGYEYIYSGGSWVNVGEVTGSTATLPDVPFTLNYNAKNYDASTHTIPYTEGALNAIDAVITGTTANIIDHSSDGYIELTGSSSTAIRALVGTTNFSRSSSSPNITIICKAYTPDSSTEGNILSNRKESYNWMYRHKSSILTFHGNSEQGSIAVSNTEPNTCSVRIDSNRLLTYNNWTQNTTSTKTNFSYGSNSNGGALFSGYYSSAGEYWKGVFYWIYMSLNTLTDEQVQQVIAYNEGGGGQIEYPLEYVVREDPPNNLVFSSMTEAEDYECPWVGMKAKIDGDNYVFSGDSTSGYEWVYNPSRLPDGYTEVEYIENTGTSYINTNLQLCSATTNTFQVEAKLVANRIGSDTYQNIFACMSEAGEPYQGFTYRFQGTTITLAFIPSNDGSFTQVTNEDSTISVTASSINGLTYSHTYPLTICCGLNSSRNPFRYTNTKVYTFKVTLNNTVVADYVPAMRDSDSKYGLYDIITDTFLVSPNGSNFIGGSLV